jgi:agmatinase
MQQGVQIDLISEERLSELTSMEKIHMILDNVREGKIVILGCPYDGSASFRPGARFGPSAIRKASWGIETYSPYLRRDLTQLSIHDMGDLELPQGEKKKSLDLIQKAIRKILSKNKFPILLGGDHLITLPILEETLKVYPNLHLLHLDAHTDLRGDYLGETLSHSTVIRRVIDRFGKGKVVSDRDSIRNRRGIQISKKDEIDRILR